MVAVVAIAVVVVVVVIVAAAAAAVEVAVTVVGFRGTRRLRSPGSRSHLRSCQRPESREGKQGKADI